MSKLPNGWVLVELAEVAATSSGGTPSRKNPENYVGKIPWIKSGNLKDGAVNEADEYISEFALKNSAAKLFPVGTILIALYGATIGKLGYLAIEAATNQAICGISLSQHAHRDYLFSFLIYHRRKLIQLGQGGAQPNISQLIVRGIEVPLPPLAEQKRIVLKIEELFSDLDDGEESLRLARRQLGVYRQSLLKQAFEGKLTETWRAENPDQLEDPDQLLARIQAERQARYDQRLKDWQAAVVAWEANGKEERKPAKPRKPKQVEPLSQDILGQWPALPTSWALVATESVGDVQLGRQRSPKNRSRDYPTPYIRAANITKEGLALDDILEMEFLPHERKIYELKKGDLVLSEASGSAAQVGKPAIWNDEIKGCCFQNTVIRHRPFITDHCVFFYWLYRYYYLHGVFSKTAGGVGINHLSANKFAKLPAPLCSLPEQQEIVRLLDEQFTVIEQNEREIDAALKRSEALRQSILRKAFTGQLVPQDPTDEPASTLLARIREERAKIAKTKPPTKKKSARKKKAARRRTRQS